MQQLCNTHTLLCSLTIRSWPEEKFTGEHGHGCWDLLVPASGLELFCYLPVDLRQDVQEMFLLAILYHGIHKRLHEPCSILGVSP